MQMPNNYILLPGFDVDSPAVEREKLSAASARVQEIADAVRKGGGTGSISPGNGPALKSVLYPMFIKYARSQNRFYATDACTNCGKCIRLCRPE